MDGVARQIFLFVAAAVSVVAFFVVLEALFPRRIARTCALAEAMPGRAFLAGMVNFLFFGGVALALFGLGERAGEGLLKAILSVPAFILLGLLGIGLSLGLGGIAVLVGQRLATRAQRDADGACQWKLTARGALALGLACLTPFAGWFILLPYVALTGLGAAILGFVLREARGGG